MICLSFLIAKKLHLYTTKNSTVLLISFLSKIGISISVFALVMSLSALNGFEKILNETILSTLPHGIIQFTDKLPLKWYQITKKLNLLPNISYSEPYIISNGLLIKNNKIQFIEIKSFSCIQFLKKDFALSKKKKNNMNEIIISDTLSKYLSAKEDDIINLIILDNQYSSIISGVKSFPLKITAVFRSQSTLDANVAFLPLKFFEKFFHVDQDINAIELHMFHPFNANQTIIDIAKEINRPTLLYTWIDSYHDVYHDIKIIKVIIYLALFLLTIIACFSITSISLITISKKTKDIAILRSIGANSLLIQLIFLYYGLRFIIIGSLVGMCSSVFIVLNFKKIVFFLKKTLHYNILSNNLYYKYFLSLQLNLLDIIIIFIGTFIIGIITSWYPAYYASKIHPSKILKEY